MIIKENQLQSIQDSFCLNSCENQGGLVWKLDWELTLATIVGESPDGKTYVVNNQPSLRNYVLQPLSNFHNKYCFYDLKNPTIDQEAMSFLAFQLLKEYNAYNGNSYLKDHKILFPLIQSIEPIKETKEIVQPSMLVPYKINEIAAPIVAGTQLVTDQILNWFQKLFIPQYSTSISKLPTARIRRIRPSLINSTSEKTA